MNLISFYSYKGGVGRTLAVANVGHAMVEDGLRKVLLIDFDLEAPGLSELSFCKPEYPPAKRGAREFITALLNGGELPNLLEHIAPIPNTYERLWIMPAGHNTHTDENGQLPDLAALADGDLLRLELIRQAEELGFHYGLVDSRTGLTEVGGLCTISLPDQLVILTGLNHQNIKGARWVLENVRHARAALGKENGEPLIVFSHVPDSEEEKKKARIAEASQTLGVQLDDVRILYYHPRLSLEEELFVKEWPESRLAITYQNLKDALWSRNPEDHRTLMRTIMERGPRRSLRPRSKTQTPEVKAEITEELQRIEKTVRKLYPTDAQLMLALAERYLSFDSTEASQRGVVVLANAFENVPPSDSDLRVKCLQLWLESTDVEGFKNACSKTIRLIQESEPDDAARLIDNLDTLRQRRSSPEMQLPKLDFLQRGHALVAPMLSQEVDKRRHWESAVLMALQQFYAGGSYTVLDRAMAGCDALLALSSPVSSDWNWVGNVRKELSDARGAEEAYAMALSLEPTNAISLRNLAETLGMTGRVNESIELCSRLAQLQPLEPQAFLIWARGLSTQGDVGAAAKLLKDQLKSHVNEVGLALAAARYMCALGGREDLNEAITILQNNTNEAPQASFLYAVTSAAIWHLKKVPANATMYLEIAEAAICERLKISPGSRKTLANGAELALIAGNKELFVKRTIVLESAENGLSERCVLLKFLYWVNEPADPPFETLEKFGSYQRRSGYQMLEWNFGDITPFLPTLLESPVLVSVARSLIDLFSGRATEEAVLKAIEQAYPAELVPHEGGA